VSGVERGGDRPFADRDGGRDRSVVEIGVVAEEENESLPLREELDRRPDELTPRIFAGRLEIRELVELMFESLLRAGITGRVHDDPPHPAIEVAATLEAIALPDGSYERLMDDVRREISTPDDGCGYATQLGQPSLVHGP
jgi:hypothetical protein